MNILFNDCCLPDYFAGHHLPVIQIPIYTPMSLKDLKEALKSELSALYEHYEYSVETDNFNEWFGEAISAINEITFVDGVKTADFGIDFSEFDFEDDFCEPCYAYFVIDQ